MQLITGKTKLLGIIGDPVEHSLSPVMHNAAIASLGLDYVYIPFPVKQGEGDLGDFWKYLYQVLVRFISFCRGASRCAPKPMVLEITLERAIAGFSANLVGFSVTIPHKQTIIPLLNEISDDAAKIGAVNTVWRTPSGWKGTNTDVEGFVAPLTAIPRDWTHVTPIVLGNGGAARAVIAGLVTLGCQEIHVVGRNPDKLARFYQSWEHAPAIHASLKIQNWENLSSLISAADLLVNTTPVGMSPQVDESPIDEDLMQKLKPQAIVYDLIYTPNPTQFLKLAKAQGAMAIDGLEMLVHQGVAALNIWLPEAEILAHQPVLVEVMRNSLNEYLGIGD